MALAVPPAPPRRRLALVITVLAATVIGVSPFDASKATPIYGDGEISCPHHVADDESRPVGSVEFQPGPGEVRVLVALTDAAPEWVYEVELWSEAGCGEQAPLGGYSDIPRITTNRNGDGQLDHVFEEIAAGTYRLNVNVISARGVPDDFRLREMGAAAFTAVTVDGDVSR